MAEYLILAETVLFKNEKLTCINIYDKFTTVAMPAEFGFDMAIMCGPKWSVGDHKLSVKAKASNGKEINLGEAIVKIPHEDFIYNAFLNNIKITMDYSVRDLTFYVYDNDKEIIARRYPVIPMLVPQQQNENAENKNKANSDKKSTKASK
ncbi:hypothetical protein IJG72_00515 [bacterium]|nr:hypothetical protein [bacterium]